MPAPTELSGQGLAQGAASSDKDLPSMGRALLVVEHFEPFEQSIFDALRREGARPIVYNLRDQEFLFPGQDIVLKPLFEPSLDTDFLHRREIETVCRQHQISRSICIGLKPAVAFAKVSPDTIADHAIISQGDFEFSSKRHPGRAQAARELANYFDRIFCVDELQFTAACDKGSQSRHFTIDVPGPVADLEKEQLDKGGDVIALIHTSTVPEEEWLPVAAQLSSDFPDKRVRAWRESDLIYALKCGVDTSLSRALLNALRGVSHVVYMGVSRNSRSLLRALAAHSPRRVAVLNHISYRLCPWDMDATFQLCDGSELSARLKEGASSRAPLPNRMLLEQIVEPSGRDLPPFYEDFQSLRHDGALSVFFSVTAVEAGSMGARVQRIRNMFRAFQRQGARPIPVSSSPPVLERRLKLIEYLIEQGRHFSFFYGENSTAPMPRYRSVGLLDRLMRVIRAQGGRLAWFIRDLHFMDADVWRVDGSAEMVDRLHLEYAAVGRHVDVLYAPTDSSLQAFRAQLPELERTEIVWKSLPPGMPAVTNSPADPDGDDKVTFVYAGGLGPVYRMDRFLKAVAALQDQPNVQFDFVVRPAEQSILEEHLKSQSRSNVRILNVPFSEYRSMSRHVVGVVLLDSAYANAGFPLKVAHYASRQTPILHYRDAAFADFVEDTGIGFSCESTDQGVLDVMNSIAGMAKRNAPIIAARNFQRAFDRNSWDNRADQVMADLGTARARAANGLLDRFRDAVL